MTIRAVDLFAGAGGFSAGARAVGVRVVWAANHNPAAVETHAVNHPETEHACQDLRQADFSRLPAFEMLIASPACQGHSCASQPRRRPKHDADRSTAWAVIDCAETCLPRVIVVENVPAFARWTLYPVWRTALETLGYGLTEIVLDAADLGVPQHRRRLFVVGLRTRARVALPRRRARQPAAAILDPAADGWAPVSTKPTGVRERVARGRARCGDRFLVHHVTDHAGRALDRPIGTITTARRHWHLVEGDRIRPLTVRELARAQGFGDEFRLPEDRPSLATRLIGNAVPPPLAAAVIESALGAGGAR